MVYVVFTNFPECHCRLDTEFLNVCYTPFTLRLLYFTMFVCDSACVAQTTASLLSTHATLLSPQSPPHPHCLCAENATDIATVAHLVQ